MLLAPIIQEFLVDPGQVTPLLPMVCHTIGRRDRPKILRNDAKTYLYKRMTRIDLQLLDGFINHTTDGSTVVTLVTMKKCINEIRKRSII